MNLPNKLTLARMLLVPVFMIFAGMALPGSGANSLVWYLVAGLVFAAASFTDFLDGYLARKWHMVTDFGKFADPLADKLLTTVALLYMMQAGVCDVWVVAIVLAREFAVSGVRMLAAGQNRVVAANWWGKAKTVLQMVTILVYYFGTYVERACFGSLGVSVDLTQIITYVLCWLVALITLVSGAIYLWQNRDCFMNAK